MSLEGTSTITLPALIEFSDWDLLYRGLWRRNNSKPGVTKIGYVTCSGTVVYPFGYGMRLVPLTKFRWHHRLIPLLPPSAYADRIEAFFTLNRENPELFIRGVRALTEDLRFFDQPIKLPILESIDPNEFEERWREFVALLRVGDSIMLIDTASVISRLIAYFDHGVWSHSATYTGDGNVAEATTSGVWWNGASMFTTLRASASGSIDRGRNSLRSNRRR